MYLQIDFARLIVLYMVEVVDYKYNETFICFKELIYASNIKVTLLYTYQKIV